MEPMINRVLQTWKSWDEKQMEIEKAIGTGKDQTNVVLKLKLNHFQKNRHLLAGTARKDEQGFLPLLDAAIKKLERQVYPNSIQRLFHRLKTLWFDRPAYILQFQQQQQANVQQLKGELANAGFSDFAGSLEKELTGERSRHVIALSSQLDKERGFDVAIHFEKDLQDVYHFSAIDATLKNPAQPEADRSVSFKMDEWPGLKAIQVKNLLDGRAIKQHYTDITGKPQSQWLEFSEENTAMKRYTKSYGYELTAAIDTLDSHIQLHDKAALQEKLESGQQVPINWNHAGGTEMIRLQADPANKLVSLTDSSNQTITPHQLNQRLESQQLERKAVIKQLTPLRPAKTRQHKKKQIQL
jgi:hypothetical protein